MKYIKLFENKWHGYLNGDLVILAYNQPEHGWIYNIYGKIINAQNNGGLLVKFEVDSRITTEELDSRDIERNFEVHLDFVSEPFSREEYEEKVKEIELDKVAKKYNL